MNTKMMILEAAKKKIEAGWTQGENARDANNMRTLAVSPTAVCWCSDGAILAAIKEVILGEEDGVIESTDEVIESTFTSLNQMMLGILAEQKTNYKYLHSWNDAPERNKEDVLELFSAGIDKVQGD